MKYLLTPGDIIVTYLTAGPLRAGINEEITSVKCEHLTGQGQVLAIIIRRQME